MSSVGSFLQDQSKRSYIATDILSSGDPPPLGVHHVYTYTKSYNANTGEWTGRLDAINFQVTPYSAYNAIGGTIFRETGKKLYPGANPGVDRYMVGVFILNQGESDPTVGDLPNQMFIDPNCSVFALFNGDRPNYIPNNVDDEAVGPLLDLGNPVYTHGVIQTTQGNILTDYGNVFVSYASNAVGNAVGSLIVGPTAAGPNNINLNNVNNCILIGSSNNSATITGSNVTNCITIGGNATITSANLSNCITIGNASVNTGLSNCIAINTTATLNNQIITAGPITAGTGITATTGNITASAGNIVATTGNITGNTITASSGFRVGTTSGAAIVGNATLVAGTVTVTNTAVTANSRIFLTYTSASGTQGFLRVGTVTAGTSFVITSSSNTDTSTVNWFIIN